jgi:hypothetical protein
MTLDYSQTEKGNDVITHVMVHELHASACFLSLRGANNADVSSTKER